MNLRRVLSQVALVIGALVFSIGLQAYAASWTAPSTGFPGGNAEAPLDTGLNVNYKAGELLVNIDSTGVIGPAVNGLVVGKNLVVQSGTIHAGSVGTTGGTRGTLSFGGVSGIADGFSINNTEGNYLKFRADSNPGTAFFVMRNDGNVGIGTASPAAKLDISGGEVKVGISGTACSASNAGAIRYNSGTFEGCNGSAWTALSGGASPGGLLSFDTAGNYTFNLTGGTTYTVQLTGGGGGGANGAGGSLLAGGGGGGGASGRFTYTPAVTETITATVGAGGKGSGGALCIYPGNPGTNTTFKTYYAEGGSGGVGLGTNGSGCSGGTSSGGSGGTTNIPAPFSWSGSPGGDGGSVSGGYGGSSGGGLGVGGVSNSPGGAPGGGGGGGNESGGPNGDPGGNGAPGKIYITW